MTSEARSLFRPEAVAYHERGLGPGNLVRHSAWVGWVYWIALVAVALGALAGVEVRVSPTITGSIGAPVSPTVLAMTVEAGTRPPIGSAVTAGGTDGRVSAVSPGPLPGTFSLRIELTRPVIANPPDSGVVHLPSERLAVWLFSSLGS